MNGQLSVLEDGVALSFRQIQLQRLSHHRRTRLASRLSTLHRICLVVRRWVFLLGHVLVPLFRLATWGKASCWSVNALTPPTRPHQRTEAGFCLPASSLWGTCPWAPCPR